MNDVRTAMMQECREHYDILSENEKKVIIYPHKEFGLGDVTFEVDKEKLSINLLIPLTHQIEYDEDAVIMDGKRRFESDGMYWVEDGCQVVEMLCASQDEMDAQQLLDVLDMVLLQGKAK